MSVLVVAAALVVAYLLGAIPGGYIIARHHGIPDLRKVGSGNVGATNVVRLLGFRAGIWVYVLDIAKGVLAEVIGLFVVQDIMGRELFLLLVALAAILGHVFPIYIGFRGGKGVNTALGTMLVLLPLETLCCVAVFLVVAFATRYISLGSILGALTLPTVLLVERYAFGWDVSDVYLIMTITIGLLVPLTHYKNVGRLLAGTESRFSLKGSGGKGASRG
ncbi:MAG: glycerol-3-phosphate 1-O-acyltransferase PlsY [candidate division Zixibacteria bacterium]|nr:glycerol-3-phosphate 1-O-acyltransferase PlsY [candidate division Zixibacteria bacterium]